MGADRAVPAPGLRDGAVRRRRGRGENQMIVDDSAWRDGDNGSGKGAPRSASAGNVASANPGLLLVDDNENHCWALSRALEKREYLVRTAHSAAAACELIQGWQPDYAVVDLRMPGPTGLTLIPRLKAVRSDMRIV